MPAVTGRLAALRLRRRGFRGMLRARCGEVEAVLGLRTRLGFASVLACAFGAGFGIRRAAFARATVAAASTSAATTTAATTPALATVSAVAAITSLLTAPAFCSLRRRLRTRFGLRRCRRLLLLILRLILLSMLRVAASALRAFGAARLRMLARLALVTLTIAPRVAAGCRLVLLIVAIAVAVAMMTTMPVTIPIAAVATVVPIATTLVRRTDGLARRGGCGLRRS